MSLDADTLYGCCPRSTACATTQQGEPLRALLALIARELGALEENLEQLYDDQFIETCADWVAPYIGDLIGYRPLHGVAPRDRLAARRGRQHHRAIAAARARR